MKTHTAWVVGISVPVIVAGILIGLGRLSARVSERNALRFAAKCEAAGFELRQCEFLADLDHRTSAAADDAAIAGLNAANASLQAAMPR